jgi:hypothetical protein
VGCRSRPGKTVRNQDFAVGRKIHTTKEVLLKMFALLVSCAHKARTCRFLVRLWSFRTRRHYLFYENYPKTVTHEYYRGVSLLYSVSFVAKGLFAMATLNSRLFADSSSSNSCAEALRPREENREYSPVALQL